MNTYSVSKLKTLGNKEMLLVDLVGKVCERIKAPVGAMPFYREKERLIAAGNLVDDFIKEGHITLTKEIKNIDGKFKTFNYVTIIGAKPLKPKDITKGFESVAGKVHQRGVRTMRLKKEDKEVLSMLSSVQFFRSEFCTDEYLKDIQADIPFDENGEEEEWLWLGRLEGYRKAALAMDNFHLSYKYDGRGRMYPEGATLEGFRPHGKAVESMAFELTKRALTEGGRSVLLELQKEGFGGTLGKLRTPQSGKALATGETGMTVECDITNSGLLIAGLCFKSPEMLSATNGYGSAVRADSHKLFGSVYGLDREQAKKVHTPLLHGASNKSIAKVLSELTGKEFTAQDVKEGNYKAYGEAAENINAIAQYGRKVMSNYRSDCSWSMPDGFRATHRAYTVHVPMELQLKSRKLRVMRSMPILLDGKGMPVYDSKTPGAHKKTATKMMGLYADIIHSIDAYVMREVVRSGVELLAKHDAFLVHPNDVVRLKEVLKKAYSEVYSKDLIRGILKQIESATSVQAPELFIGSAKNKMGSSNLFVTVE